MTWRGPPTVINPVRACSGPSLFPSPLLTCWKLLVCEDRPSICIQRKRFGGGPSTLQNEPRALQCVCGLCRGRCALSTWRLDKRRDASKPRAELWGRALETEARMSLLADGSRARGTSLWGVRTLQFC